MSFDHTILKGTTSKIVEVILRDSSTGAGKTAVAYTDVTASYVREGGTRTAITLASGTAGDAYSTGKWCEVDATNCPGLYQLHLPNAALATGVDAVTITLIAADTIDKVIRISLLDVDLRNAANAGMSNLDAAVSSRSTFNSAADQVTVATNNDKTEYALSSAANDAIGAAFLAYTLTKGDPGTIERAFWQSLRSTQLAEGEISGTPTTSAFDTDLSAVSGAYNHLLLLITSGTLSGEARPIDSYDQTNGRIVLQEELTSVPSAGDEFFIVPSHVHSIPTIQAGLARSSELASLATAASIAGLNVNINNVYDLAAYQLTATVGAINNAQTASESYQLVVGGSTYTVTGNEMTELGNRGLPTLGKS